MANFDAQVIELVGTTYTTDQDALNQFITEGANEVINAMPRPIMERVAKETTFTNSTSSEGHKILHVLKNDGTIDQPCRLVLASKRGRIQDSSDMEFATSSDPAYYVQNSLVTLFPTGSGGKLVSMPTYSQSSPLDASAIATITNFPNEYEYLVVLYAAIKSLQQVLNSIVLADASISYSNASVGDGIAAAVDSITVAPTDAAGTGSTASTASAYTKPTVGGTGDELTDITSLDSENTIDDFDGNAIEVDQWFATAAHLIEDQEDSELAQLQISKISSYINAFQAEVQSAQSAMQATIEDARQSTQASIATAGDATRASVANAQNDVQASIQKMQLSTQASIQKMQLSTNVNITNAAKTMEAIIQDYAALVTEKTNEYNWALGQQGKLQVDYDKGIQIMRGA
jgi:hypothetical protein